MDLLSRRVDVVGGGSRLSEAQRLILLSDSAQEYRSQEGFPLGRVLGTQRSYNVLPNDFQVIQ